MAYQPYPQTAAIEYFDYLDSGQNIYDTDTVVYEWGPGQAGPYTPPLLHGTGWPPTGQHLGPNEILQYWILHTGHIIYQYTSEYFYDPYNGGAALPEKDTDLANPVPTYSVEVERNIIALPLPGSALKNYGSRIAGWTAYIFGGSGVDIINPDKFNREGQNIGRWYEPFVDNVSYTYDAGRGVWVHVYTWMYYVRRSAAVFYVPGIPGGSIVPLLPALLGPFLPLLPFLLPLAFAFPAMPLIGMGDPGAYGAGGSVNNNAGRRRRQQASSI